MNGSRQRLVRRGFTLIEAIVIIVILGVIAAVIAPRLINRIGASRTAVAQSNAQSLATAMKLFGADCNGVLDSDTIDVLWEQPSRADDAAWKGPYVDSEDDLQDPWGNKFILVVSNSKNVDFDIVSYGADGRPGGEGEDADIVAP